MAIVVLNPRRARVQIRRLRRAVEAALEAEGAAGGCVTLLLTDDGVLRDLNYRFRGKDRPTDVLSFSSEPAPGSPEAAHAPRELGDIAISIPRAAEQARAVGHSLQAEVEHLAVHGVLHLLGYDDETEAGAAEMREREGRILSLM